MPTGDRPPTTTATASPGAVTIDIGRRAVPRLLAGSIAFLLLGAGLVAVSFGVEQDTAATAYVGAAIGMFFLLLGVACAYGVRRSRGARVVLDADGVRRIDSTGPVWDVRWDDLEAVGISILLWRPPTGSQLVGPRRERMVRLVLAVPEGSAPAAEKALLAQRTRDEPEPWTHRVTFGSSDPDWREALEIGLDRHAGDRYRGVTERRTFRRRYS